MAKKEKKMKTKIVQFFGKPDEKNPQPYTIGYQGGKRVFKAVLKKVKPLTEAEVYELWKLENLRNSTLYMSQGDYDRFKYLIEKNRLQGYFK